MMALSSQINGKNGFDLLPSTSQVTARLQGIGTQQLALSRQTINARTFHYGVFETTLEPITTATAKYGQGEAVYQYGSITASLLHFYFPSNLSATAALFLP